MEKTGRQRLTEIWNMDRPRKCTNCGGEGFYRVTFEGVYNKLTVTLCEECEQLKYEQLKLQSQIDWPIAAGAEKQG